LSGLAWGLFLLLTLAGSIVMPEWVNAVGVEVNKAAVEAPLGGRPVRASA
jgi:hypothetical protein